MLATATIPHAEAENPSTILPVVRVEYTNVEDFLVDYTSNETIGGMFIKTERPMAVGTAFQMRIQLPGGRRCDRRRGGGPLDAASGCGHTDDARDGCPLRQPFVL